VPVWITRWPGKPTSGRSVYRGRDSGAWYWQCDLHPDEDWTDEWGIADTWGEVMAAAIAHAVHCSFVAVSAGSENDR